MMLNIAMNKYFQSVRKTKFSKLLARIWIYGRILWRRVVVVVGYPGVTDAGNGGPWEWRPLGIADRNQDETHIGSIGSHMETWVVYGLHVGMLARNWFVIY